VGKSVSEMTYFVSGIYLITSTFPHFTSIGLYERTFFRVVQLLYADRYPV